MGYTREQEAGAQASQLRRIENPPAGSVIIEEAPPPVQIQGPQSSQGQLRGRKWSMPSMKGGRVEQIGFLVVVAAALVVLFLFAGVLIPRILGGVITALYTAVFVSMLTLSNLRRPSGWANSMLGRQVFPVLKVQGDGQIWRLALVNGILVFIFAFAFDLLASFITPLLAGIALFGLLTVATVGYSRVRRVLRRP